MKKKLLIMLILFLPFIIKAETIKMDWQKNFGGSQGEEYEDIISTSDGGFIEVGTFSSSNIDGLQNKGKSDILIIKYDDEGNILWKKSWGGEENEYYENIALMNDGFVVIGETWSNNIDGLTNKGYEDFFLVKFDEAGNMIWQNFFGSDDMYERGNVISLSDDSLISFLDSSSTNIENHENRGESDIIISKYDKTGNTVWQKTWGGNKDEQLSKAISTIDGGFIASFITYSTDINNIKNQGDADIAIVKFDKDGNIIWQKSWGGNNSEYITDIIQTRDEGYAIVGYTGSYNIEELPNLHGGRKDIIIFKYDKNGRLLWQNSWGGSHDEWGNNIFETLEGEIIITGTTRSSDIEGIPVPSEEDAIIAKYDKDGNLLWNTSYKQLPYSSNITDGIVMSDGTFIATIEVYEYDMGNGCGEDTVLISYDKNGNIIWEKHWGGSHWDVFNDVLLLNNNEIIVSGFTGSTDIDGINNNGRSDALVIKYSIIYDLENVTNENNNGTSTVEQQGRYGIVKPTPNEGYEVDKIIVKDKSGNVLDVEVTKQEDGTYSFELYTDVSVEVLFKEKLVNPKTGVSSFIGLMFTLMLIGISGFFMIRNCNNSYEL